MRDEVVFLSGGQLGPGLKKYLHALHTSTGDGAAAMSGVSSG
jgi:hypothetical protein